MVVVGRLGRARSGGRAAVSVPENSTAICGGTVGRLTWTERCEHGGRRPSAPAPELLGTGGSTAGVKFARVRLAGDLEGVADERPPLVMLHGLTFDRSVWRPVLEPLRLRDPGGRC